MRLANRSILTALVLSGLALWLGLSWSLPGVVATSVVAGWAAVVLSIAVFGVTFILLVIRAPSGNAGPLLKRSGLPIVNFLLALLAIWLLFGFRIS